ncbi:MAG: prepilin-type N-terminal cleavage/methylation domain-containing protein [Elusimicrobiaceae bacterium]|nr:prepilin-type N-terminal cleavage/methylation domain-containing protein [Elusimicrobiaceae bacterium]
MQKGFTLMEMLAVGLMLAVIMSLATPVVRSFRYEIKNAQARTAAGKLAQGFRNYLKDMKCTEVPDYGCFSPEDDVIQTDASQCTSQKNTGVPTSPSLCAALPTDRVARQKTLFACGYVAYKDFAKSPYEFCLGRKKNSADAAAPVSPYYVTVYGLDGAGTKYKYASSNRKFIYVDGRMEVRDNY